MPLYEYQCERCGHRFETIQKFSDPPLEECPKCGGVVKKRQSAPAFQFKGSGWYITDYGRKDSGSEKAADSAAPATAKTDGAKADSSSTSADSAASAKPSDPTPSKS
jgi:putative FmdB family regulatory protein